MMKSIVKLLFCGTLFLLSCSKNGSDKEITGLWKSRDQHSDKPRSLVAVYKYEDKYYGRMLATYDDNGKIKDSIVDPKEKAPGVVGNPPYCGMDFVYNVEKEQDKEKYKGKIIDPEKGKIYDAELWREGEVLIVRGELWVFGKNIPWSQASEKDLPEGFAMGDIKKFVPEVPKVN